MNKFIYIDNERKEIQDKSFVCIYVLEMSTKNLFHIYKPYSQQFQEKLNTLKPYENITNICYFVIKRDGKISIDINLKY